MTNIKKYATLFASQLNGCEAILKSGVAPTNNVGAWRKMKVISLRLAGVECHLLTAYLHLANLLEGKNWREIVDSLLEKCRKKFNDAELAGIIAVGYSDIENSDYLSEENLERMVRLFGTNSKVLWNSTEIDPLITAKDMPNYCPAGTKIWDLGTRCYLCAVVRISVPGGKLPVAYALIPEERIDK